MWRVAGTDEGRLEEVDVGDAVDVLVAVDVVVAEAEGDLEGDRIGRFQFFLGQVRVVGFLGFGKEGCGDFLGDLGDGALVEVDVDPEAGAAGDELFAHEYGEVAVAAEALDAGGPGFHVYQLIVFGPAKDFEGDAVEHPGLATGDHGAGAAVEVVRVAYGGFLKELEPASEGDAFLAVHFKVIDRVL